MKFAPIASLLPHEEIRPPHLMRLYHEIESLGLFTTPIVVCQDSNIILDGHHRYTAMKTMLGTTYIPVYAIDYQDSELSEVRSWNEGDVVTKTDVLNAGLSESLMKPKCSRHEFGFEQHEISVPLELLRRELA